jgi:hypothetical protein
MSPLFSFTRLTFLAACCVALLAVGTSAVAQPPPPPLVAGSTAAGDPPTQVGRLARVSGGVSFHGLGAAQWVPATPNLPLSNGDGLATDAEGRAEIELAAGVLSLDEGSELDIEGLSDTALTASLPRGRVLLGLHGLVPGQSVALRTPRGTVTIAVQGRYVVAAGDGATPTSVTVLEGSAQVNGTGIALLVGAGQSAQISGAPPFQTSLGPAAADAVFDEQQTAPLPLPQPVPPPPVVAAMPGGADLAAYGTWQPTPAYGTVWYPEVAAGWMPYRDGRWVYLQPWGWTWVDNANWGFAPFHYGRWVMVGDRWAWAPVYAPPGFAAPSVYSPVYAPALVTFFGVGVLAVGSSVGWVPLGWNEPYRPWYHHSSGYFQAVNRPVLQNVNAMTNARNATNLTANNFANRRAVTVVPAAAMTSSAPIGRAVLPPGRVPQAGAMRVAPLPPVAPTPHNSGVRPAPPAGGAVAAPFVAPTPNRAAVAPIREPPPAVAARPPAQTYRPQVQAAPQTFRPPPPQAAPRAAPERQPERRCDPNQRC